MWGWVIEGGWVLKGSRGSNKGKLGEVVVREGSKWRGSMGSEEWVSKGIEGRDNRKSMGRGSREGNHGIEGK